MSSIGCCGAAGRTNAAQHNHHNAHHTDDTGSGCMSKSEHKALHSMLKHSAGQDKKDAAANKKHAKELEDLWKNIMKDGKIDAKELAELLSKAGVDPKDLQDDGGGCGGGTGVKKHSRGSGTPASKAELEKLWKEIMKDGKIDAKEMADLLSMAGVGTSTKQNDDDTVQT